MTRTLKYVCIALLIANQPVLTSFGQTTDAKTIEERILAAWTERSKRLDTFELACSFRRVDMVPANAVAGDPFGGGNSPDKREIALNSKFTLAAKGKKIVMKSRGEVWDETKQSPIVQDYSSSFDGTYNKALLNAEAYKLPAAMIDNTGNAARELVANTHYIPLWLSFSPSQTLTRLGFQVERLTVIEKVVDHDTRALIVLSIPHGGRPCSVYVDASMGYLPVKYIEMRNDGRMRSAIDIQYQKNDALGYVVSSFASDLYGERNEIETSLFGKVERIVVNRPVADEVFEIELPIGTSIRETLDGKVRNYIQEAKDQRREITAGN